MAHTAELKTSLKNGEYDGKILSICADSSRLDYERARYISAIETFESLFGAGDVAVFSAPGRSEVCGNHTDHQHGIVLACSINRDAIAVASVRDDGLIRVKSGDGSLIEFSVDDVEIDESMYGTTVSLIKGVIKGIKDRGYNAGGFECYITSDVLIGAGLSSSAAFETVIGTVINSFYNDMQISAVEIAQIGQFAENVFFGKPCGLMDQMACSVGSLVFIDFEDPEKPVVESVELDLGKYGYSLAITDTKGSHSDLTADYAAVPEEMCAVAALFGCRFLREVSESDFLAHISVVRERCGDRAALRALHFYAENRRVKEAVDAIRGGDVTAFLDAVKRSGDSSFKYLQNVYTNHDVEHQNVSIALCVSDRILGGGNGVSRVHGGGFAGTVQAFVSDGVVDEYKMEMDRVFGVGSCNILKIRPCGGIRVI